ncbi:MAG TPA: glutamate synthase large subunit [Solirubrobacterales bacterium]|nr:glutamate synthase large subunit [Solirubrobacterales bacterium]
MIELPAQAGPSHRRGDGLYDPAAEHDGCGVAAVARLDGVPLHDVVTRALTALDDLEHRGAAGADTTTGDGAGILIQIPHAFLASRVEEFGLPAGTLPDLGEYALGMAFLPANPTRRDELVALFEQTAEEHGQRVIGWRSVPVEHANAGRSALEAVPEIRQVLVERGPEIRDVDAFERRLFVIRRIVELATDEALHFASLSARTVTYKGMLTAPQLALFYPDLRDPQLASALAVVHSRFSTNTFPSWELAHPYRYSAHNGEINTLRGNLAWMRARESTLRSAEIGPDLERCLPLIPDGASDSAAFDRALELLLLAGRSLPHALMMLIPMAHETNPELAEELHGFYRFHASLMEPWDGPAAIVGSDGQMLAATLDRNGLRPGRWLVTDDGWVVLGSEAGVLPFDAERVVRRGRLRPGHLFTVDLATGRVSDEYDSELEVARRRPYGEWFEEGAISLEDLPPKPPPREREPLAKRQLAFGYSQEDLRVLIAPAANDAMEPVGSMGNDVALAALSEKAPSLFSYFKQRYAQVTNPAIDSVRESTVMSLESRLGPGHNILTEGKEQARQLVLEHPVLRNEDLERIARSSHPVIRPATLDITWPLADGAEGIDAALRRLCREVDEALAEGATVLILSDRNVGPERVPIPSLLALGCVHHHLVRAGTRLRASLVVESGEPREVHHLAALIGFGATAINPYLMLDSLDDLRGRAELEGDLGPEEARDRLVQAMRKGLLKTISKIGIATISSYCGAQIFEAVGLDRDLVERHFNGTPSSVGGVGIEQLAREALDRHARAYPQEHGRSLPEHVEESGLAVDHARLLPQGGIYAWRRDGERHAWDPGTIAALQQAARNPDRPELYEDFATRVNEENAALGLLRGLFRLRPLGDPVPLDEVEPAAEIARRFVTGGMSLGALSPEAHETLAVAMNRLGGLSNSGEGGEDERRNVPDPNGDLRRSRIRQVASGRFGVTAHYLAVADQIQIKISQGSKPGEGGQLPGHKVDHYIAKLRFSTPGVGLISPPPHHDIYSIEDLKQLIYDLRAANPTASVSVKLAAEAGVGTVAAGVAKAGADHVVIAGHDGGTGASPLSSIQAAGVPWELGLAETQQTLLRNHLRSRITVQVDGGMRTGRDVVIGALLGAEEFGFATAPVIATGCIMMRVCHLNTCPVGVATQDPELRKHFAGRPEHVVDYLIAVAGEVREILASLGAKSLPEIVGRTELIEVDASGMGPKAQTLDLDPLLEVPEEASAAERHRTEDPPPFDAHFDARELLAEAEPALARDEPVRIARSVTNVDRAIGGRLSHEVVSRHGADGLRSGQITVELAGSAGQSFGAWLAPGITLSLEGETNDYAGKGLSGGVISVRPPKGAAFDAAENVIAGNVCLYGATGGRAFFSGLAGERFAVRNSGAIAVVEGVGDHGCEYMTGGRVIVLGPTGRNFAAGMSGGIAYVYDPHGRFQDRVNTELVDLMAVPEEAHDGLRGVVTEHLQHTGSALAARLLADWPATLTAMVRVLPREYAKALAGELDFEPPHTISSRTVPA